jgi:nitrogen-specific signal transduction histidine kinase
MIASGSLGKEIRFVYLRPVLFRCKERSMGKKTHFASADRSTAKQVMNEYEIAGSEKFFTEVFGAMTGIGAILNKNRQIIYANNEFLSVLGMDSLEPILGKRPGETLSCMHASEALSGCGTSRACAYCGVVNTFLESQKTGMKAMKEAQISSIIDGKHKSWDMNVISAPITLNGELFYVLILQDISEAKRRAALERIFFHDLLNSVGGLYGLLSVLKEETSPEQSRELINLSEEASRNIIEEILVQRQLRAAETGELIIKTEQINSIELLDSVILKIGFHEAGRERRIVRDEGSADIDFETDRTLLQRVMINLLKNALEATDINDTVSTGVRNNGDKIIFWVKNNQVMTEDIQMQLFQRSFSTKGAGRGLGTYSIRLLTENFLKGRVTFVSDNKNGTVFSIELNKSF